ncbi:MAG: LytTR family DNA-binding domain-containing protein [Ignavibacteria bacterium]|nr:LytTR family DNA-binding domain-containing protein [Ignavibacteria bacterium]
MIRCIAIDDEPLALKKLADYIEKTPFLELVALCESAWQANEIIHNSQVDLMFVDINMPDLNGMDFVKSLQIKTEIVFTTAYSEYAVEGFKVDALDYLLKPFAYSDFLKAANKAKVLFEKEAQLNEQLQIKEHQLFIKSDYKIVRIEMDDILYIEGMREYVRIHLSNAKPLMTLISMKKLEEILPKTNFMRVHRSFIVNLRKITTIERNRIVYDDNVYIPVSEQYKADFNAYIEQYFI